MRYYEILKKRRIDLKLSIQDVSAQTRLAPEYIKAIEENNLDVFSDDLSFVRYFIRSYCEALGVNWAVLQQEVEGSIKHYAHLRNMALTQAQKRMVESMQAETNPSRMRRQTRSSYQNHVASTSRSLSRKPRRRISMKAVILALVIVAGAGGVWFVMDRMSADQEAAAAAAADQEARDKEAETARLAQLRRQEQGITDPSDQAEDEKAAQDVTTVSGNTVTVSSAFQTPAAVTIQAEFPAVTTVWLTQDGEALNDPAESGESFEQTVTLDAPGTLLFQPAEAEGMKLTVNGQQVDATADASGQTIIIINVEQRQTGTDQSQGDENEPAE